MPKVLFAPPAKAFIAQEIRRLDYELTEDAVLILLVRHGRQGEPGLPLADDADYEVR